MKPDKKRTAGSTYCEWVVTGQSVTHARLTTSRVMQHRPTAIGYKGCVKRLAQGCGSTLEKSKTRLPICFRPQASTPLVRAERYSVCSLTRRPAPCRLHSGSNHEAVRALDSNPRSLTLDIYRSRVRNRTASRRNPPRPPPTPTPPGYSCAT